VARGAGHLRVSRGRTPVTRTPRGRAPAGRVRGAHDEATAIGRSATMAGEPETAAAAVSVQTLEPADPVLRAPSRSVVLV